MNATTECPCCASALEYEIGETEVTCPECGVMFGVEP
jgi:predicted RNA-binding Zn-ribbon protein involved in translation (DUF1610 family)